MNQADLMAIVTVMAMTLQRLVSDNTNQPPPKNGIKYHYESIRKNRDPTFNGNPDPEARQG